MKKRGSFWSEKEIFRDFRLGKQTQIYDLSLFTQRPTQSCSSLLEFDHRYFPTMSPA